MSTFERFSSEGKRSVNCKLLDADHDRPTHASKD